MHSLPACSFILHFANEMSRSRPSQASDGPGGGIAPRTAAAGAPAAAFSHALRKCPFVLQCPHVFSLAGH